MAGALDTQGLAACTCSVTTGSDRQAQPLVAPPLQENDCEPAALQRGTPPSNLFPE
jgi:hypothetical protein